MGREATVGARVRIDGRGAANRDRCWRKNDRREPESTDVGPAPEVALGYDATTDRRKDLTTASKLSGWS